MKSALRKASATMQRDTLLAPLSLDEESRTVEAVIATETGVLRVNNWGYQCTEILLCDRASIVTTRLDAGLPVLDSHDRYSIDAVLGRSIKYRISNGKVYSTWKFADTERGRNAFDLVASGMVTRVSVGYRIIDSEESKDADNQYVQTVTRWEPREFSLVSIPADENAKIRGNAMAKRSRAAANQAPDDDFDNRDDQETDDDDFEGRTIERPAPRQRSRNADREIDDIRMQAVRAGLDIRAVDREFEDVRSARQARERVFEMLAAKSKGNRTQPFRDDDSARSQGDNIDDQVVDAIAVRLGAAPSKDDNPLRERSLVEIGRSYFSANGVDMRSMDDRRVINMILGENPSRGRSWGWGMSARAAHTTSDFPSLLLDGTNRALTERFGIEDTPLKRLGRKRNLNDYRASSLIRPGEAPKLERRLESGEIKHGTTKTEFETMRLTNYARMFSMTREMIINDDLGAFADIMQAMAEAARSTEGDLFYELLSSNNFGGVKTSDGRNFFHADHGNLADSPAALDITQISDARKAMRLQKNVTGTGTAGVVPKILLVGPELETVAERILTLINAAKTEDANPFAGRLELMVENRLVGRHWYLFGDPQARPAFSYGYLNGNEGPVVESKDAWDTLGREFRCYMDFGCGPLDFRTAYKSVDPG